MDGRPKGWVAMADDLSAYFARTIRELVAGAAGDDAPAVVAIDIPIGLPRSGPRQADVLDAAAVMWTARRFRDGRAVSHPDVPEFFEGEHEAAIWV
ncbi:MAG: DUF429 domain-containing protein [Kineosporiaceae bacterium]